MTAELAPAPIVDDSTAERKAKRMELQALLLPVVLVILVIVGTVEDKDIFLRKDNFIQILAQASVVGVVALGMTFVIATGGIDLSSGSVLAAAAIAGGQFVDDGALVYIGATIGAALVLGIVNGAAIAYGRIVPFIATLAMLTGARGVALWMSDKTPISLSDLDMVSSLGRGKFLTIQMPVWIFAGCAIVAWFVLNRTVFGRRVVAVGGNREAARIAGITPQRIVFAVYAIAGLCVGIAAILATGRLGSASPVAGQLLELDAIAAVVIGGTSLAGGRATIVGTTLGVITFQLIFNLLNQFGLSAEIQDITKALIVLGAALIQRGDLRR